MKEKKNADVCMFIFAMCMCVYLLFGTSDFMWKKKVYWVEKQMKKSFLFINTVLKQVLKDGENLNVK